MKYDDVLNDWKYLNYNIGTIRSCTHGAEKCSYMEQLLEDPSRVKAKAIIIKLINTWFYRGIVPVTCLDCDSLSDIVVMYPHLQSIINKYEINIELCPIHFSESIIAGGT